MIRAAFFGTPAEAVPSLASLCRVAEVVLVVTNPDRPKGRSRRPVASPVKEAAGAWGLPLLQPDRAAGAASPLESEGVDVAVVVAYGQIIPPDLLAVPRRGFVNVHFSLLPRWRGASPVVRCILAGDEETGVTIMEMDAGLDTGPVIASERTPIRSDETAGRLTARLAARGADLLSRTLGDYVEGNVQPEPQDEAEATAAAKVRIEEAHLDPTRHSTIAVSRAVRAFNPRPGAWGVVDGERLKVWSTREAPAGVRPPAGEVVEAGRAVVLGTRDGALELGSVQPANRGRMEAAAWLRGRRGEPARFEPPTR